jgi:demethylmenaquinone methyltransferase/2-methoxy-6-polyprenyl-1,4-benzoquinol methylase
MRSGSSRPSNSAGATRAAIERDPAAIRSLFARIAQRYDLANHLLSGGLDFWWRHRAAKLVRQWRPDRILDLAAGSGDLALALARQIPEAEITAADFSAEMLAVARTKGLTNTVVADALRLPFAEASFEAVAVAFGLRNMADWSAALREILRVLAPGGHLLVLDFSLPQARQLQALYRFYLHRCLPAIARLVTGEAEAYRYLGASIEEFPSGEAMRALLQENGFRAPRSQPLSGGIVTIYCASKPNDPAETLPVKL